MSPHKLMQGYLWIKSKKNQWKRRYFVIYNDKRVVEYYKNEMYSRSRNNAKGSIQLMQMEKVMFVKNNICKSRSFSSANPRIHQNVLSESKTTINGWNLCQAEETDMDLSDQSSSVSLDYTSPLKRNRLLSAIDESTDKTPRFSTFHSDSALYTKKHRRSVFFQSFDSAIVNDEDDVQDSENDEDSVFREILKNSSLKMKCERNYTFALVSSANIIELAAENNADLKKWVLLLHKLCQGKRIHDGYLNDDKYFVLHANKVLNCFDNKYHIEQDIDLRQCLYIKFDELNANEIHLGVRANERKKQNICLSAENRLIALEWFNQIKSLFGDNESFKKLHYSKCQNINITHNQSQLKNRFIAMYREYLVIFPNKKQFDSITKMTFFNKQIFGDMLRREKCILVPMSNLTKIRKASRAHGKYAFVISDVDGDRKWYFTLSSGQILGEWMRALCFKRLRSKKKRSPKGVKSYSIDIEIESSLSSTSSSLFQ